MGERDSGHDESVKPGIAEVALDAQTLDPSQESCALVEEPIVSERQLLTEDGRLMKGRLAGLSMNRAIWIIAWPIMVESYLNSLVGLTDTTLASQISPEATDAIGVASYFVWFIGLIAMALATGATALVSRSIGKHRLAVANAAVGQAYLVAVVSGIVVGGLMALLAPAIAGIVNLESEARGAFIGYIRIVSAGVPMSSVLFAGIACLRGAGDSYRPLVAMGICNVVNIIVSFALAGVPIQTSKLVDGVLQTHQLVPAVPGPRLGILGIAIGTTAAHTVGAVLITVFLLRGQSGVTLLRRRMVPHRTTLARLLRLGAPNFAESLGMWLGNFLVVMFVGWLALGTRLAGGDGDGIFGAHIWGIRIEAFSFLPGFAMGMAAAALAGQYLGAGSPSLARTAILRCTFIGAGVMGLMGAMFVLIPERIIGLFTAQPIHLELVPRLLVICGFVQIPFGIALVIRSALRGAGDVKVVMWITWISTYVLRLPLAYALSGVDVYVTRHLADGEIVHQVLIHNPFPEFPGITGGLGGLWLGLCSELVLRCLLFLARFIHGGWSRVRV
ncbi:MAG TPA: MATE family efflux transporter [Phycisphaerales bacterium]|nr:MATE family efflux transporter [Phycisphaerales bacterium]